MKSLYEHGGQDPSPFLKAINYMAAFMGIGSFLGLVNLVVGVLSAGWLGIQLYGYVRYELPLKKAKRARAELELHRLTSRLEEDGCE